MCAKEEHYNGEREVEGKSNRTIRFWVNGIVEASMTLDHSDLVLQHFSRNSKNITSAVVNRSAVCTQYISRLLFRTFSRSDILSKKKEKKRYSFYAQGIDSAKRVERRSMELPFAFATFGTSRR
jgi:hypothetical protein